MRYSPPLGNKTRRGAAFFGPKFPIARTGFCLETRNSFKALKYKSDVSLARTLHKSSRFQFRGSRHAAPAKLRQGRVLPLCPATFPLLWLKFRTYEVRSRPAGDQTPWLPLPVCFGKRARRLAPTK
jgi:hypothetical protein